MRPSHHDALDRWLAAERDDRHGADAEAEAALFELFEALPLIAPPAGFADRVLVRAGLQAAARRDVFASRWVRLLVALCLVSLGLGILWLPPVLRFLAGLWSFDGVVQGAIRVLTDAMEWLATVLRFWEPLLDVSRALTQALTAPQVMAGLVVCLLVSSVAFRLLRDQISGERNWTYVDPI